jgi:acyl carrier protein
MDTASQGTQSIVVKVIAEELDVKPDELVPSCSLVEDLSADSLALINIVMKLEEQLDIKVSDEDWRNLRTVGDVISFVDRTVAAHTSAASNAN